MNSSELLRYSAREIRAILVAGERMAGAASDRMFLSSWSDDLTEEQGIHWKE
jgi:hypothetical protein